MAQVIVFEHLHFSYPQLDLTLNKMKIFISKQFEYSATPRGDCFDVGEKNWGFEIVHVCCVLSVVEWKAMLDINLSHSKISHPGPQGYWAHEKLPAGPYILSNANKEKWWALTAHHWQMKLKIGPTCLYHPPMHPHWSTRCWLHICFTRSQLGHQQLHSLHAQQLKVTQLPCSQGCNGRHGSTVDRSIKFIGRASF